MSVLGAMAFLLAPAVGAAPRKLHPGTVKCTLVRYKPKIRVDRYDCEVITYKNGSSEVFAANGFSLKFPTKVRKPYTVMSLNPITINKWKDYTLQIEGLAEYWQNR
jgi:hypothetical protein